MKIVKLCTTLFLFLGSSQAIAKTKTNNFWQAVHTISTDTTIQQASENIIETKEFACLALTSYIESRGTKEEQTLVADVVINRAKTKLWGQTLCSTILADHPSVGKPFHAFPWVRTIHTKAIDFESQDWINSVEATRQALTQPDESKGATFFAKKAVKTSWTTPENIVHLEKKHLRHRYYRPPLPLTNGEFDEVASAPETGNLLKNSPYQ